MSPPPLSAGHRKTTLPTNGPPLLLHSSHHRQRRVIGRICRWNSRHQNYDDWEYIFDHQATRMVEQVSVDTWYRGDTNGNGTGERYTTAKPERRMVTCWKLPLKHRGGGETRKSGQKSRTSRNENDAWIKVYPNFVDEAKSDRIADSILNSGKFRQYKIGMHNEPRIHFLVGTGQSLLPMAAARAAQKAKTKHHHQEHYRCSQHSAGSKNNGINKNTEEGYYYHGVNLKSECLLSEFPDLLDVTVEAAQLCGLMHGMSGVDNNNNNNNNSNNNNNTSKYQYPTHQPQPVPDPFNIGVNPVVYRNFDDSINWHADDTHKEYRVFAFVPKTTSTPMVIGGHAYYLPRPLCVRRKLQRGKQLEDGDEYIELFVDAGDAYEMNGQMQEHYEHAVPKVKNDANNKSAGEVSNDGDDDDELDKLRMSIIFRHGARRLVEQDSGQAVTTLSPPVKPTSDVLYPFGPMKHVLKEGALYKRSYLAETHAHSDDQRGVCGKKEWGCCSIVVARQRREEEELDAFQNLLYTSQGRQGAGALLKSYQDEKPIRVFRSSLCPHFAAVNPNTRKGAPAVYRYDGLYLIKCAFETEWLKRGRLPSTSEAPVGSDSATFLLRRIDEKENTLTTSELFLQSVKNKNIDPHPFMKGCSKWKPHQFTEFFQNLWKDHLEHMKKRSKERNGFLPRKKKRLTHEFSTLPVPAPTTDKDILPLVTPSPRQCQVDRPRLPVDKAINPEESYDEMPPLSLPKLSLNQYVSPPRPVPVDETIEPKEMPPLSLPLRLPLDETMYPEQFSGKMPPLSPLKMTLNQFEVASEPLPNSYSCRGNALQTERKQCQSNTEENDKIVLNVRQLYEAQMANEELILAAYADKRRYKLREDGQYKIICFRFDESCDFQPVIPPESFEWFHRTHGNSQFPPSDVQDPTNSQTKDPKMSLTDATYQQVPPKRNVSPPIKITGSIEPQQEKVIGFLPKKFLSEDIAFEITGSQEPVRLFGI